MRQLALFPVTDQVKPFLKWVGGKRQLLPQMTPLLPKTFNNYYEPFVGGGALLFHLLPDNAVISDANPELINAYQTIKKDYQPVVKILKSFNYSPTDFAAIREWDREYDYLTKYSPEERTARFIYINRCGFNALWRVNKKGYCNTPIGRYDSPDFVQEKVLRECHIYLQKVIIKNCDYSEAIKEAKAGDFVYLDPPYDPVSTSANFTSYHKNGFNKDDQITLSDYVKLLSKKGVMVMISNSCTDFIKGLYLEYSQYNLSAKRNINSMADKRGTVTEILVTNY